MRSSSNHLLHAIRSFRFTGVRGWPHVIAGVAEGVAKGNALAHRARGQAFDVPTLVSDTHV
jgi:hypothetical protein